MSQYLLASALEFELLFSWNISELQDGFQDFVDLRGFDDGGLNTSSVE